MENFVQVFFSLFSSYTCCCRHHCYCCCSRANCKLKKYPHIHHQNRTLFTTSFVSRTHSFEFILASFILSFFFRRVLMLFTLCLSLLLFFSRLSPYLFVCVCLCNHRGYVCDVFYDINSSYGVFRNEIAYHKSEID